MIKGGTRLIRDLFGIIWNLQRFPILKTRNWFWMDTNHMERILLVMKIVRNIKTHSNWLSTWTDGILTGLWVLKDSTLLLEIWGLSLFILCVCRSLFHQYLEYCTKKIRILLHNLFQFIVNVCTGQQLVRTTKSFVYVKPSKRLIWGMSNSYYSHVAKLLPNDFHMHCWSNQRL